MRKNLLFVLLTLSCLSAIADNLNDYNVRSFGAVGDGKNLDSPAINTAIESAFANGGGKIIVPAGIYLCGSIHLKSNIELHLLPGAIIKAAPASMKVYDESESFGGFPEYQDGGHTYFHNSLIWAEGQDNISITGRGMIDGEGLTKKDTENAGNVQGGSIGTGDKAIALKLCTNILIRDITIFRGGHFAIIITGCEKGTIDNVTIDTNRDGIDIDCCKYLTVTNTKVNTPNDDGIVLKSSYALKKPVPCENILINNCIVTGYKLGTFLDGTYIPEKVNWVCGRIKLGTESNGGYRNIAISNCTMMYSSGLAFEEVDQGRMENIAVSNITMNPPLSMFVERTLPTSVESISLEVTSSSSPICSRDLCGVILRFATAIVSASAFSAGCEFPFSSAASVSAAAPCRDAKTCCMVLSCESS